MRRATIVLFVLLAASAGADQVMPEWEAGTEAFRRGDFAAAVAQFEVVARLQPVYAPGHYMLGVSLWRLGRPDEAVLHLQRAVALAGPGSPRFTVALGQLLAELDRPAEALAALRVVTPEALGAEDEAAYATVLASVVVAAGGLDEEVARWRDRPAVLAGLAHELAVAGRAEEAFAAYLGGGSGEVAGQRLRLALVLAVEQAEDDPETWYPRAERAAAALVAAQTESADAWLQLGQLRVRRERWDEALEALDRARAQGGDDFAVSYWRGQAEAGLRNWGAALRDFDRALAAAEAEDRSRVQARRARALHELGRLSEAVTAYRAAGEEEPAAALAAALAARDDAEAECRALAAEMTSLMHDAADAGIAPEEIRRRMLDAHPECAAALAAPET